MAKKQGISLSLKVRDLVKEAIEKHEDRELLRFAREREKTFDRAHALSHEQVWRHLKKRK